MYLTWGIYALFLLMLLCGGRFAGFGRDRFHEDPMAWDATRSLRGFAAVGVMLHHISQEQPLQDAHEMSLFVNAGFFFVAIFLFCSGYGLYMSLTEKPGYLDSFPRKRLKYVLIPFYVNIAVFAVYKLICGVRLPALQWVTNALGLSMMNEYAWYPIVLLILYLAYWLCFRRAEKPGVPILLIFALTLVMGVIFCAEGHCAWWAGKKNWFIYGFSSEWWMQQKVWWFNGEWWVNSAVAFPIGIAFAANREKLNAWLKKGYWFKLAACLALCVSFHWLSRYLQGAFGYWSEYAGRGPGIGNKLICFAGQLPEVGFFVCSLYMILMKYRAVNPVGRFFGRISLESYLYNLIPIEVFRFLLYTRYGSPIRQAGHLNMVWYALAVLAASTLLGWIFHRLDNLISGKKDH